MLLPDLYPAQGLQRASRPKFGPFIISLQFFEVSGFFSISPSLSRA